MIICDNPDYQDVAAGKYWTGGKGKELIHLLRDAGIYPDNCWMTAVSKYEVPPNTKGDKKIPFAVRAARVGLNVPEMISELQEEVNAIKPNCILALGSTPLWALTGKTEIGDYRGSILRGMGVKLVPSYNPRDLLFNTTGSEFKGYWNRQIMAFDFKRAHKQSQFPEVNLPIRTLEICRTSHQFAEFLARYPIDKYRKVYVDIEALGVGLPGCIGFSFTRGHGITVPLWNVNGISTIPDSDLTQLWLMINEVLTTRQVVGQNFNYDRDKILRLGFTVPYYIGDIMFKALAINPELPKSLAFNTSIYTEEPFYKNEGMYEGSVEDLLIGCARDACVTCEIDEEMDADLDELKQRKYYENYLMKLPDMYWAMERQGFHVDIEARDRLMHKYIAWDERLRYRLYQLTGTDINVNSPKQISTLLYENYKLPNKYSTGEEAITELLNSPKIAEREEVVEVLELILEDRRVRKSVSTYLMALADFDGRMRTTFFPCLETGRSSTGQQDPPIRPKVEVYDEDGKKKKKVLGIAFQTMTKHGDIGADIREMYVPDPPDTNLETIMEAERLLGRPLTDEDFEEVFVQADSSQAEARVVWLLADDEEALKLVDTIDYHAFTATWFFGTNEELFNYDKKKLGYEHPIRFCGKTLRHAGHLGAGKRRASISVNTDARKFKIPIHISEAVAERALKIFHTRQPRIQAVFQNGVVECLKRNRTLIAPLPYGIDAEYGGRRTFFERWGEELFRQAFSYIPQRTVTDNTKAAGLRIRQRCKNIKIVMESHDALLFCMPKWRLQFWTPIIKEEMERPIDFSNCSIPRRSLSIPCEIETGTNYCHMTKFKDIPLVFNPQEPELVPRNVTEQFAMIELPKDSKLTDVIYENQQRKFERRFEID